MAAKLNILTMHHSGGYAPSYLYRIIADHYRSEVCRFPSTAVLKKRHVFELSGKFSWVKSSFCFSDMFVRWCVYLGEETLTLNSEQDLELNGSDA